MLKHIDVTAVTGPRNSGITTLIKLIEKLANCPKMVAIDVETILDTHKERHTKTGKILREAENFTRQGHYPDDLLVASGSLEWFQNLVPIRYPKAEHILIGRFPNGQFQNEVLGHFASSRIVHVNATKEQTMRNARNVLEREVLETAWKEYCKKTAAVIAVLNGSTIPVEFSQPLEEKIATIIDNMTIPGHVRKNMIKRLQTRDHPVRREIRCIQGL